MQRREREWFFSHNADGVSNNSAGVLAAFVLTLSDDLNTITAQASQLFDGRLEFATEVVESLPLAWGDVRRDAVFGAWEFLCNVDEVDLGPAGLTGPQLRLKVTAWDESRQALDRLFGETGSLRSSRSDGPDALSEVHPRFREAYVLSPQLPLLSGRPRRRWGKLLRRIAVTLGYADTILGSIPIRNAAIERLKECKEIVEKFSGDAGDVLNN